MMLFILGSVSLKILCWSWGLQVLKVDLMVGNLSNSYCWFWKFVLICWKIMIWSLTSEVWIKQCTLGVFPNWLLSSFWPVGFFHPLVFGYTCLNPRAHFNDFVNWIIDLSSPSGCVIHVFYTTWVLPFWFLSIRKKRVYYSDRLIIRRMHGFSSLSMFRKIWVPGFLEKTGYTEDHFWKICDCIFDLFICFRPMYVWFHARSWSWIWKWIGWMSPIPLDS